MEIIVGMVIGGVVGSFLLWLGLKTGEVALKGWRSRHEPPPSPVTDNPPRLDNLVTAEKIVAERPEPEPDADEPDNEDEIEPLIFGRHHFVQHCPNEDDEPWLVHRLDLTESDFYVQTKEHALELMERADAYRDQRP